MKRPLVLAAGILLTTLPLPNAKADHRGFSGRPVTVSPRAAAAARSFSTARSFGSVPRTSYRAMPLARSNFRYTPAIASQSFAFGGRGLNPYVGVRPNYRYTSSIAARSFAVGGRGLNPYVGVRPNYRNYSYGNRFANGALPFATYRYWDRHHDHEWNHHHYRGAGNSWVIIDGGYGYPYGYPYYYDDGYYSAPYVTSPPVYNTPDVGPTDSLGAEVQQALADQGYYHDAIDGDVGPMTRDAIAAYQRDHQLPVTGTITAPLLDSLGLN